MHRAEGDDVLAARLMVIKAIIEQRRFSLRPLSLMVSMPEAQLREVVERSTWTSKGLRMIEPLVSQLDDAIGLLTWTRSQRRNEGH